MRWRLVQRRTQVGIARGVVGSTGARTSTQLATELAAQILVELDPDLLRYLASTDRRLELEDGALLAERLAILGSSQNAQLVAAVAALEATTRGHERELQRLETRVADLAGESVSRLAIAAIVVGVMTAGVAVVAGVAQVLQWIESGG